MPRIPLSRRSAAVAAALLLALAAPAGAHTRLEWSSPAAGDTVPEVTEVRIRFTQRVEPRFTALVLRHAGAALRTDSLRPVPGSGGREFVLRLPGGLPGGAYTAAWRTAGADGHVITGEFTFTVEPPPGADTAAVAPPPPLEHDTTAVASTEPPAALRPGGPLPVLIRWTGYLALLGMLGAVAFMLAVVHRLRRGGEHTAAADRAGYATWYVALGVAALSVVSLAARLWAQSAALNGAALAFEGDRLDALLTGTVWGFAWVLQAVATVAFVLGLFVARAPHGGSVGWMGAGVGAFLLAWVPALSGHAAAVERLQALAIVTATLHVVGAGLWLGTLGLLLAAGVPAALAAPDGGPGTLRAMVTAFSPVALAGGALAGLTGVGNALFHLGSPGELFGTAYGRTLLLKLALLGVVAALGWYHWRIAQPRLGTPETSSPFRRSATAEIAVGAAVLLVTAILVAVPTPM